MKKNLILFSSPFISPQINNHIKDMVVKTDKAVYIPAGMQFSPFDSRWYDKLGFKESERFSIAYDFDESRLESIFEADMIHIGGGNTFLLLYLLKIRGLIPLLQDYVAEGGLLVGNSAGAIVMSNDIMIANIADDDCVGSSDISGLGMVDFEIKPHFEGYISDMKYFDIYSKAKGSTVYGLKEDDAIVIKNGKFIPIGSPMEFNGVL